MPNPTRSIRPFVAPRLVALLVLAGCGGGAVVEAHGSASETSASAETSTTGSGAETPSTAVPGAPDRVSPPPALPAVSTSPRRDARYYVRLASASTLSSEVGQELLAAAGARVRVTVGALDGVELAPSGEPVATGVALVRERALHGVYIQCSVRRVEAGPQGTRAAIAMLVTTFDERDVLASLQGGALVPGSSGVQAERAAIEGAVDSAIRGLPTVLASLAAR